MPSDFGNSQKLYNGVRFPLAEPCPANVRRLDMGSYPLVDAMMRHGILLDLDKLKDISDQCSSLMAEAEADIQMIVGKKINPASPKQVSELLWKKLRIQGTDQIPVTDSGGDSTGADTLKMFVDRHPVVQPILDWRQYQKIQGTYADKLPRLIDSNGRIHTRLKTTRTSTGRLASEDPNLQNIPSRSKLGATIRAAFIASPGWKLVGRDLSQIEMRVVAHLAGEQSMIEGYCDPDWDMHTQTAMDIFRLKREQVDPVKHRLPAKSCGFGVVYLIGPDGLQKSIAGAGGGVWDQDACQALLDRFYATKKAISEWQEEQFHRVRLHHMVWTDFGRHRIIPQARSCLNWVVQAGFREGANQPVQGMAGDILKLAQAEIWDIMTAYNKKEERVRPLLAVHDELIFEVKEDYTDEWDEIVKDSMENCVELDVPILSSGAVGDNWQEIK